MSPRCSICHNGPAFTDNKFHNVAVAQFGPGPGDGPDGLDDFGRMRVTGQAEDSYAFRTPPLRNVVLTAPYGHDGAIHQSAGLHRPLQRVGPQAAEFRPQPLEPLLRGPMLATAEQILATRDTLLNGVVFPPVV